MLIVMFSDKQVGRKRFQPNLGKLPQFVRRECAVNGHTSGSCNVASECSPPNHADHGATVIFPVIVP
jgi:hypothetical protein